MKHWLYLSLPEAINSSIEMYKDEFDEHIAELAEVSDNESVASLKIEDGSFDRCKSIQASNSGLTASMEIGGLLDVIDRRKRGYQNAIADKNFLEQELLPTLKELAEGMQPMRAHQAVIEEAISDAFKPYNHVSGDWIPETYKPSQPWVTSELVSQFLENLRKEVVKATGIERVLPKPVENTR